jgi:hypothetical protein
MTSCFVLIDAVIDLDEQDPEAIPVLARVDQAVAGIARMLGGGHIGRLAVLKSVRGRGKKTGAIPCGNCRETLADKIRMER